MNGLNSYLKDSPYIKVQEFLAVREGIKPVLIAGINMKFINQIRELCKKHKLHLLVKNLDFHRTASDKSTVAYISKSRNLAKQVYEAEADIDDRKLGKLLGYPECCTNCFKNETSRLVNDKFSFVLHTFSKTKGKPSFYANNVFNFESRLGNANKLSIFNKNIVILGKYPHYFLISHIPCSYKCKESVRMGEEILKLLENEDQQLAKNIISALKKPFLVIDDFNWVSFDGKVDKNSIRYHKAEPFLTLYPKDKFIQGNKVIVDSDKIKIFKDENLLHEIRKPVKNARIIDFS